MDRNYGLVPPYICFAENSYGNEDRDYRVFFDKPGRDFIPFYLRKDKKGSGVLQLKTRLAEEREANLVREVMKFLCPALI
ncbi:MAG: hypothetical protein HZA17_10340 [Nitrospirae bacterium]|nr:hypothetical protein [Nitrospirota bacterium]